jgi:hypothetical protein
MLPLFLFIIAVSYITWLLMDMMMCGLMMTCNGDLRGTGSAWSSGHSQWFPHGTQTCVPHIRSSSRSASDW